MKKFFVVDKQTSTVQLTYTLILSSILFLSCVCIPDAHAATNANLFVSAENSQWHNYFAGPQVIQVVVADPDINRLDQQYGEPIVNVNGKRLRMAQATDGNWYAFFADRNQAIAAANTATLTGKGLNFGAFCDPSSTFSPMPGVTYAETNGFTLARGGFGAVNHTSTFTITSNNLGACANVQGKLTTNQMEHVVRQNKTLNSNPNGFDAPYSTYSQIWPVIQLYDFSAIPTTVTVDYQKSGGDQIVNLTFDKIPQNLITTTVDENAYQQNSQVKTRINDPQLNIDPTEEDSWTWGTNANNNTLYYEAFTRNGVTDADGTAGMQNLIGNLTTFMFNHNGKLTIDASAQSERIIDFQSNGKQTYTGIQRGDPLLVRTSSIGVGSQPLTLIEGGGVNTGIFVSWDGSTKSNIVTLDSPTIKGQSATVRYNDMLTNILADIITPEVVSVSTDLSSYKQGDTIVVSGMVNQIVPNTDVVISILDTHNNLVTTSQVMPSSDGSFGNAFVAIGQLWADAGTYTVKAQYGQSSQPVTTAFYFSGVTGQPVITPSLVVANYDSNSISVLLGTGTGSFGTQTNYATGRLPDSVAVGDFNEDGKQDIAVSSIVGNSGTVSVLLGTGTGSFSAPTNFTVNGIPGSVVTGDFNGDGKLDIATANFNSDTVSILLGTGTGSFSTPTNFAVGSNPGSVVAGDFNGDGKLDLAVTNWISGTVSVLLGTGTGSFSTLTNYSVGPNPASVAVGDFNGDGKTDLAVVSSSSGTISVLLGDGTGSFGTPTIFGTGYGSNSVVIGDFNGDGKSDLAVANQFSNNVSILLGTGTGSFGTATNFPVGNQPLSVAVIDLPLSNPSTQNVVIETGAGAGASVACVATNNCFSPNPITVEPGTTVTWTNTDKISHTITSGKVSDDNSGSMFDTGLLKPGKTFQFTFANSGIYNYFCTVHPWMIGQVIVGQGSQPNNPNANVTTPYKLLHQNGTINQAILPSLYVKTDLPSYNQGDMITTKVAINGMVSDKNIAISVTDPSGNDIISRVLSTNDYGSSYIQFKIPETAQIGTYQVTVTASVSGNNLEQTTQFTVNSRYDISIVSVQPTDQQGNPVNSFTRGGIGFVKVVLLGQSNQNGLITVNLFDSDFTSLGIGSLKGSMSGGQSEIVLSFSIPKDAVIGTSNIYADAFSDYPSKGGTPLTKEISSMVEIK